MSLCTHTYLWQSRNDIRHLGDKNYQLSTKSTESNMFNFVADLSPVSATVGFVASVYRALGSGVWHSGTWWAVSCLANEVLKMKRALLAVFVIAVVLLGLNIILASWSLKWVAVPNRQLSSWSAERNSVLTLQRTSHWRMSRKAALRTVCTEWSMTGTLSPVKMSCGPTGRCDGADCHYNYQCKYWSVIFIAWSVCIAWTMPSQNLCPSVCHMPVSCVLTVTHILKNFSSSGSPTPNGMAVFRREPP